MDDFLNQFLSSSSWSDANLTERSSWVGNGPGETNGLLSNSMRAFEGEETNSPANMINTSHVIESLLAQNTSMLGGRQSSYAMGKSLLNGESKLQKEGPICDSETSLLECVNGNMKPGYMDLQLDTPMSTKCAPNHDPSELLPAAVGPVKSPSLHPESGSVGSNDSEQSEFQPTLRDSHSLTSVPQLWHPSYGSASSLSSIIMQDELKGYDLQGQYLDHGTAVLGNEYLGDEKFPRSNLYASLALPINGQDELNGHCLSSAARHYIPLGRAADLHSHSQLPHVPSTPGGNCSGTAKPRVRARRGQATDPHSIAERLRREKIAERMKNLQELVPNSNKTDKASMLDEIIEYVKFLQLQVKVLSMSRLGAAGAVVPLITDVQAEGSGGLLVSRSTGEGADPPFVSPDDLAFEQEVVKLMESSMTTAMQFLQSKGVCLMPIALASAISGKKASLPSSISSEKKKSILTTGIGHTKNGSANTTTGQKSLDGSEIVSKESVAGTSNRQHILINGCNGAANGVVIKQEEVKNTAIIATTRETQPENN